MEGFNLEIGAMKARATASEKLASAINELTGPLCDYPRVSSEKVDLEKQKASLMKQVSFCKNYGKIVTYIIAAFISLLFLLILNSAKAAIPVFILFGIICALIFPAVAMILLQYWDNVEKGTTDTEAAIEAHKKTLSNFDAVINDHKDIEIPEMYRNRRAMEFIRDAVKSQKATTIDHAISQFDDVLRTEKSIALQEEQIKLQKQQIEETRKLQNGEAVSKKRSVSGRNTVVIRQHGHSIIIHLLLCSVGIGFITIPYYTLSKRHYWHL